MHHRNCLLKSLREDNSYSIIPRNVHDFHHMAHRDTHQIGKADLGCHVFGDRHPRTLDATQITLSNGRLPCNQVVDLGNPPQ